MTWTAGADALAAVLTDAGFDVDLAGVSSDGGSLTARRDRGTATDLMAIDASGRFRATLTRTVGTPTTGVATIAGLPLRLLTEQTRAVTVVGQLDDPGQLRALLPRLDALARSPLHPNDDPHAPRR